LLGLRPSQARGRVCGGQCPTNPECKAGEEPRLALARICYVEFVRTKTSRQRERTNATAACCCLRSDLCVIGTGFATCIPPQGRHAGRSHPPSMRCRSALREWCLCENSRPPSRQQVRPGKNLLKAVSPRCAPSLSLGLQAL